MCVTVYFWQISKDWFYIVLLGYVLQVLSAILCFFLPESPAFLLSLNRVEEALNIFKRIARVNGATATFDIQAAQEITAPLTEEQEEDEAV